MKNFIQTTTHYLKKPLYKDYYKWLIKFLKKNKIKSFIDIGCASGYLSYYMPENISILGIDINNILLKKAKKINKNKSKNFRNIDLINCPEKNFLKLAKKNNLYNYPLITFFGTFDIFDDSRQVIKRLTRLKPKKIIMSLYLNEDGYNIKIAYKKESEKKMQYTNISSTESIIQSFLRCNYRVKLIKYDTKKTLKRDKSDPIRNYHISLKNGKKILTNGLGILRSEYLMVATKKSKI